MTGPTGEDRDTAPAAAAAAAEDPGARSGDGSGRGLRRVGRQVRAQTDEFQSQIRSTRAEIRQQVRSSRAQLKEANDRVTARSGRNLVFAIFFGVLLGGSMLASLLIVKDAFLLLAALVVGFGTFELAGALRHAGRDVPKTASVAVAVLALPVAYYLPNGPVLAVAGALAVVTVWRLVEVALASSRPSPRDVGADLAVGAFVQLYITLLAVCAVVLVGLPDGELWTVVFLTAVVVSDIGAYASGLRFGKHPMAPRISPKKTWEGFAGAAAATVLVTTVLSVLVLDEAWWFGVLFGAVLLVTGTIGDLTESLIKRDLGIKDISSWLPGHGGFLDRIDSILPSAAAALLLYLAVH